MRDKFLADAQSALLALLFGAEAKANSYLDNLTPTRLERCTALQWASQS